MKKNIVFVTSSNFKKEENKILIEKLDFKKGKKIDDFLDIQIREIDVPERLEVDLEKMVRYEVKDAYDKIKVPCFVEHAGLIFKKYYDDGYPGGLTKPMWNSLGQSFIKETQSHGIQVIAKAVIAYCDGLCVETFEGETTGIISDKMRGEREFYWDTIFIPDDPKYNPEQKTYAEIVEEKDLAYKVLHLSQSTKAKIKLFNYLVSNPPKNLW